MDKSTFRAVAAALCLLPVLIPACSTEDDPDTRAAFASGFPVPVDYMGIIHAGSSGDNREYPLLDEYSVSWVHWDFSWSTIEPSDDNWNFEAFDTHVRNANDNNKKVFGMLLYDVDWIHTEPGDRPRGVPYVTGDELPDYLDYVRETVAHYDGKDGRPKVDAWAIWNEPNLDDRFWCGTKEEFYNLTREAAAVIREANPDAVIVGGAFNSIAADEWVTGIFTSGAMEKVDYIAYHPYMPSPEVSFNRYASFKALVTPYGFADKIWITEIGYPTAGTAGGTEALVIPDEEFPEALIKTIAYLTGAGPKALFWYHLRDHDNPQTNNSEDWFGLFNYDFTPKRGAPAYKLCAENIPGKTCRAFTGSNLPDYLRAWYYQGGDGKHTLIICNTRRSKSVNLRIELPGDNPQKYNIVTGAPEPVPSPYDAHIAGGEDSVLFFTWENPAGTLPGISTR
jgi:hypothetical protein